jgi:hypothetical protein
MPEQQLLQSKNNDKENDKEKKNLENLMKEANPFGGADPFKYVAGEVMKVIRGAMVPEPEDPAYQFARKITDACLDESQSSVKELIHDGLSIGVYRLLEELVGSIYKKR